MAVIFIGLRCVVSSPAPPATDDLDQIRHIFMGLTCMFSVELRGFESLLDQAKCPFTCRFVPSRSDSVPLVTCGFVSSIDDVVVGNHFCCLAFWESPTRALGP
jgi:hypothetical protein